MSIIPSLFISSDSLYPGSFEVIPKSFATSTRSFMANPPPVASALATTTSPDASSAVVNRAPLPFELPLDLHYDNVLKIPYKH